MGLGAKLNFAFITVILVMVLSSAGYSLVMDYLHTKEEATKRVDLFIKKISEEFNKVAETNHQGAEAIAHEPKLLETISAGNRDETGKVLKDFVNQTGFSGFVAIVDPKGQLFYSTEMPAKSGDNVRSEGSGIDYVLMQNNFWRGSSDFSPANTITISSMLPVPFGSQGNGVLSLNEPLTSEFLTGFVTKFALQPDHLTGVDMALVSAKENKVVAFTSGLVGTDGGFLKKVDAGGMKSFSMSTFEEGGRLWRPFPLEQSKDHLVGVLLVTTPVPSIIPKATLVAGQAGIAGAIALVLSFIFVGGISGSVSRPLQFLIQRGRDLAGGKSTLPPLEGLDGEWLELGELMDTSVSSMRSSVQSLKSQLQKHNFDVDERIRVAEASGTQLETVNRQLADKTRQLTEVSKQVNVANQQVSLMQTKLDSVLQISTEGFLVLDQFGNVLSANPVVLNWMGVNVGEIAGQYCFDLVKKPGDGRSNGPGSAFSRHGGDSADVISNFYPEGVVYHRYQEKSVEVLANLLPVMTEDANIQGYIMVLHDKSLRSEIAHLRSEIVAMLQDSIRLPLVNVEGTWKSLLRDASQTMSPQAGQTLAQLHSQYEQVIGVVDSLLMMYGGILPPPVIPKEQVVITRLVGDCLEEVAAKAQEKNLRLDYKTGMLPEVRIDRETVYRGTVQLLEKVIEITAPNGKVRVETLIKGNEMRIGFYSSGPAISPGEVEDMFAGFIQGKHMEETYSQRLNMYLAANNIERVGGKVWAESREGQGTAIFFTMGIV